MISLKPKLIETYLPLDALAQAAVNEMRAGVGAPSSLHLWWGNRQVAISKALIFAQLVDAPEFGDDEKRRCIHQVLDSLLKGDELVEPLARELIRESCNGVYPTIYDPFCGIGTVPFAALSLGIPAVGCELNPVAAFVARCATGSIRSEVDKNFVMCAVDNVDRELKKRLKENYPTVKVTPSMAKDRPDVAKYVGRELQVEMWVWVRTVPDPNPAFEGCPVPLCTNFVTGAKKGRESWVEVVALKTKKEYKFVVHSGIAPEGAEKGTRQGKADFKSIFDGRAITIDYIRQQGKAGRLGVRMMAIFAQGDDGEKVVLSPTKEQEKIALSIESETPQMPFVEGTKNCSACNFGFKGYGELFSSRQKALLGELREIILEYASRGKKERYAANIIALAYSQFVSWNSTSNTYWNQHQYPRNVFARQTIPLGWDFAEANPIEASMKCWGQIAYGVVEKFFALRAVPSGIIRAEDVAKGSVEELSVVNCDVPDYDNVPYAELADFFYVWLCPILKDLHSDIAFVESSPRDEELTAFACRDKGKVDVDAYYRMKVARAFRAISNRVRRDYPSVFSFDFRSATFSKRDIAPMAAFVDGLVSAGFKITAAWPLKDVRPSAVFGGEAGNGFKSIYFVCRLREDDKTISRREFVSRLKSRMPTALKFYRTLDKSLASTGYAYAAVAAGLRIYSDYKQVLNADGSVFGVADIIEEVLKVTDEIKAGECQGDSCEVSLREGIIDELRRGVNPEQLRKRIYESYLKAEDSGRLEESAQYNEILNEWNDLIEEIKQ